MPDVGAYYRWSTRVSKLQPAVERILLAIPIMGLPQRKAVLTACRAQFPPSFGSRVFERNREAWMTILTLDDRHRPLVDRSGLYHHVTLQELCSPSTPIFSSPVLSGFISSALRSAPIEQSDSFLEALPKAIAKEIQASTTEYRPIRFDYGCIFGDQSMRSKTFAPNLDANPEVAESIHLAFSRVRESLADTILYPRCSSKTVGREVGREFWQTTTSVIHDLVWEESQSVSGAVTTQMLQKAEYWSGLTVPGPVEVRTAWKYNDLKPRVYFAQGGTTFPSSKYIQHISNVLVDSLEPVHRKNRYQPVEQELNREESAIIYDYASFTSTLDEIHGFIEGLADFMGGTEVVLVGHQDGPAVVDLGDLLRQFARDCNHFAEFDISESSGSSIPVLIQQAGSRTSGTHQPSFSTRVAC